MGVGSRRRRARAPGIDLAHYVVDLAVVTAVETLQNVGTNAER